MKYSALLLSVGFTFACEQTLRLPPRSDSSLDASSNDASSNDASPIDATDSSLADANMEEAQSDTAVDAMRANTIEVPTYTAWAASTFPCSNLAQTMWYSSLDWPIDGAMLSMDLGDRESPLLVLSDRRTDRGPTSYFDLVFVRYDVEPPLVVRREFGNARIGRIRVDAMGRTHATYRTPEGLFYLRLTTGGTGTAVLVDAAGTESDLVFEANDTAHIVYYRATSGGLGRLRYVQVQNGSTLGAMLDVDDRGDTGQRPALLAVDDGTFWVSYHDVQNARLSLTHFRPDTVLARETIDADTAPICTFGRAGISSELARTQDGRLVLAYTSQCTGASNEPDLVFLRTQTADGWTRRLVARASNGSLSYYRPALSVLGDDAYILMGAFFARANLREATRPVETGRETSFQRGSPALTATRSGGLLTAFSDGTNLRFQRCPRAPEM